MKYNIVNRNTSQARDVDTSTVNKKNYCVVNIEFLPIKVVLMRVRAKRRFLLHSSLTRSTTSVHAWVRTILSLEKPFIMSKSNARSKSRRKGKETRTLNGGDRNNRHRLQQLAQIPKPFRHTIHSKYAHRRKEIVNKEEHAP